MVKDKAPVVVYGGSFDPPHRGHSLLAEAALRQLEPRALYFVPNYRTPFKDLRPVPYRSRAEMLKLALRASGLAGRPEIKISSWEADLRRSVYTWETLEHFSRLHPGAPLYFLMGSDCLAGFPRWRRPGRILRLARLLVGPRPGFAAPRAGAVPYTPLAGRFPEAASSGLRVKLFLGARPAEMEPGVLDFIEREGLYLAAERRALRAALSPGRYAHCLAVARLAAELAPGLGLPAQAGAVAGLLHDCARELPHARQLELARAGATPGARLAETDRRAPVLLHAWAGAALAGTRYGAGDPAVLEAAALHATGAPGMGPLARLAYVCDLAGEDRAFPEAAVVRRLARRDFAAAFRAANYVKLSYALRKGGWVHPLSVELWNSLLTEKKS